MRKTSAAVSMVVGVVGILAFAVPASAKDAGKKGAGAAVLTPAADVKWADVPGFPAVKMAVVEGDPTKGAHHSFLKFTAGFAAPLHHHTADHYVTVVAGTVILVVDGKENKLPVGSYFSLTGMAKHETKCDAGAECVLFVDARAKWDVVPEADAKKPADPKAK